MMNWNWPATEYNDLYSWHQILRHLIFCPLVYFAIGLLWLSAFCGWGLREANDVVKDALWSWK